MKFCSTIFCMFLFIGCLMPPSPIFFKYKIIEKNGEDLNIKTHATVVGNKLLDISTSVLLINNKTELLEIEKIEYKIQYPHITFDTTLTEKSMSTKLKFRKEESNLVKPLIVSINDTLKIHFISVPEENIDRENFINLWKEDTLQISIIIDNEVYDYKLIGSY